MSFTSTYETQPGKGALFANAHKVTGELTITGNFKLPRKYNEIMLLLEGTPIGGGGIALIGTAIGLEGCVVEGVIAPHPDYTDPDYKGGVINVGGLAVEVNSKTVIDQGGKPYRFMWFKSDTVRVAC